MPTLKANAKPSECSLIFFCMEWCHQHRVISLAEKPWQRQRRWRWLRRVEELKIFNGNYTGVFHFFAVLHTRLNPIYSRAGGSTISYIYLYQVRNTLLRINYLTCLVSTMASSGFGPYHGMSLEDAQTKCVGVIPTPWSMTHALGLVQFPPQHE